MNPSILTIIVLSVLLFVALSVIFYLFYITIPSLKRSEAERWWIRCCRPDATYYDMEQLKAILRINKISIGTLDNASIDTFDIVKKNIIIREAEKALEKLRKDPVGYPIGYNYQQLREFLNEGITFADIKFGDDEMEKIERMILVAKGQHELLQFSNSYTSTLQNYLQQGITKEELVPKEESSSL